MREKQIAIYKYALPKVHNIEGSYAVPANGKPIKVMKQGEEPKLWVEVDPTETQTEQIKVRCVWTGKESMIPIIGEYIDSVQLNINGQLIVCHYYLTDY